MTIKSNQALLNAPFGSILLTFKDGELIRCELSEAAVEEDLGSFADHKAVQALTSAALLVLWVPPAETIRCRFLLGVIVLSERAIWADSRIRPPMSQ